MTPYSIPLNLVSFKLSPTPLYPLLSGGGESSKVVHPGVFRFSGAAPPPPPPTAAKNHNGRGRHHHHHLLRRRVNWGKIKSDNGAGFVVETIVGVVVVAPESIIVCCCSCFPHLHHLVPQWWGLKVRGRFFFRCFCVGVFLNVSWPRRVLNGKRFWWVGTVLKYFFTYFYQFSATLH